MPHASQAINAHSSSEIGKANKSPREKLRIDARPKKEPGLHPIIATPFVIVGRILSTVVRDGQRARARWPAPGPQIAQLGKFAARPFDRSGVIGDICDALLVLCFVLTGERRRRQHACEVILMGGARMERQRSNWLLRIAIVLLATSVPRAALAQEGKPLTPIQMFDPEAGQGLRISPSFILHPEATVAVLRNSNIYDLDQFETSDTIFVLMPRFLLESDFSRHRFELFGGADVRRYAKTSGENSEAADIGAKGLLELGGAINVLAELKLARGVEQRGTAGDQFLSDTPIVYTRKDAFLSISRTQHKLEVELKGKVSRSDYDDTSAGGVPVDLSDRDLIARDASLRLGFNLGTRVQLFTQISANRLSYQAPASKLRDSSGYALLAGAKVQVTNLIDLEAGLGYIWQDFDSAGFKPVKALNYHLAANWTPTPRWLVAASVDRAIDGSPLANVPAVFRTSYKLEAKHALGNRLLLGAGLAHVREEYREIARIDRRYQAGISAQLRLTPNIGVQAAADYRKQDGGLIGRNYKGVSASLALRIIG